ncbi:MAG: Gfo/Idh/MocA family oxidoreductase [Actinomycetota bacterium]|nr:Gfo/Idh/MocA family oxidoreductase [Actinomycetota bacterium]
MSRARLRLAVVGTGSMGSLHARVINASERATLEVVVEPRKEAGQPVAERFGARWAPDLDGLGSVDSVIVAAATDAHPALALAIIEAGYPLLIEKPIADTLAAAERIIQASIAAGTPLMCGLLERYNGAVVTALAATRDPLHVAAMRHSPYAPRINTGVAWDLLVHDVDISLRVMGAEPSDVQGRLGYFHPESAAGAEDMAECLLSFPNRSMAAISASRLGQHKVRSLTITELNRQIAVDLLRQSVTIYRHVPTDAEPEDGLGYRQQTIIDIPTLISTREPLAVQLDRFIDVQAGHLDMDHERASFLPVHRVIETMVAPWRRTKAPLPPAAALVHVDAGEDQNAEPSSE